MTFELIGDGKGTVRGLAAELDVAKPVITRGANDSPAAYAATALTVGMVLATRLNPLWLIAGGAIAGITGLL